jgi:restriction endonuclease S subunit
MPITRKFDNILANPPFGIKGLKYDDFNHSLKNAYTPIKSDNAVSLFIQAIIYMLKINGKCAIVLPHGQDLLSKSNKTMVSIREYLMKTCDLKEIIFLPPGIFTHTTIKTCVFYFVKKREGCDVLETNIKLSKKHTETNRSYKFSKTHQTSSIKFYEYNPYEDIKDLLVEVPIEKIRDNSYSLNYTEYLVDEPDDYNEDDIVVKTLGEICNFLPKSKRNAKYGNKEGMFPFFKSSIKVDSYVDEPDYEEESLIIGDGGEANINYGIRFSTSDHCYILQNKNKSLLNLKYSYYYLFHNLGIMKQLYTGVGIKNISKSSIEGIKIPMPSLKQQETIVKYLDFIYEKSIKKSNEKIADLKMANEFYLNNQEMSSCNVMKTLGEVCQIKCGNHSTKKCNFIEGEYLIIGGGKQPIGKHNDYNCHENTILCASHGSAGYISMYPVKTFLTMAFAFIENKQLINKMYLYYYLKSIEEYISSLGKGTAQHCISMEKLKSIEIPVPSLKRQQEIIEYCESNDRLIQQLKTEIETNKREAQRFIKSIVKLDTEDEEDINNITCEEEKDEDKEEQDDENEYDEDDEEEDEDDDEYDVNSMITNFKFTSDTISSDLNEIVNGFTQNLMKLVMDNYKDNKKIQPSIELQNEVEYDDDEE